MRFVYLSGFLSVLAAAAAEPFDVKAHYTKYEHMIPMRDGVRLHTAVYIPKDDSKDYPILMNRTPYSIRPYGVDAYRSHLGPSDRFAEEGYIFVYQDVRGRMGSEGTFVNVTPHVPNKAGPADIDESSDTYDTVEWLIRNVPSHNGKVGQWGISYPGFYTAAGMIDAHPALKAVSPQAPVIDWFVGDDFHHNGAFYLAHAFRFTTRFDQPVDEPTRTRPPPFDYRTPDAYEFYLKLGPLRNVNESHFEYKSPLWNELMQHGTYDAFWKARNLRPHLKNIRPAVMTVGGWFDAEDLFGPLVVYEAVEKNSPGAYNMLVMGPWYHGQWARDSGDRLGHVPFNAKTAEFYQEKIEFPFFQHFLKGQDDPELPDAYMFETGTNQWRRYDSWPPKNVSTRTLYFHDKGRLSFDPPTGATGQFEEYVSDPDKPVPFIPNIAISMTREHMLDDQRFASTRPDVLVFQTDELEDDIILAGPIRNTLHVSTTGTDSDWIVKLIDVYPGDFPDPDPNPTGVRMGGYQQLIRGEAIRGKFRNSLEEPEPFEPGKPTRIEYVMPDVYHAFRRGHRIMVQVQSTWFPLVDRNPQKFVDIYNATEDDFQKATQRVYRSGRQASWLQVQVLTTPRGGS